jgi:hypothetical protein
MAVLASLFYVIAEPDTHTFQVWLLIADGILIPALWFLFRKMFTTRTDMANREIRKLQEEAKKIQAAIDESNGARTEMQKAIALLDWKMTTEIADRKELERRFGNLKQDVDRGVTDRQAGRRER